MRRSSRLAILTASLVALGGCDGGDPDDTGFETNDSGASSDTGSDTDTSTDTDTNADTDVADGGGELHLVLGYINPDVTGLEITLDGAELEAGLAASALAVEGYFFAPGQNDPGFAVSTGDHELVVTYTYSLPECLDPPDCTNIEFRDATRTETTSFSVEDGDSVVAASILSFAFTGQEIIAEGFSLAETITVPQPDGRGLFVIQGGSSGVNGPMDVRVTELGSTGTDEAKGSVMLNGSAMLSVPFSSQLMVGVTHINGSTYKNYDFGSIPADSVSLMVVRASNQAPYIPKANGNGAFQLQEFGN